MKLALKMKSIISHKDFIHIYLINFHLNLYPVYLLIHIMLIKEAILWVFTSYFQAISLGYFIKKERYSTENVYKPCYNLIR